jgi:uncharacterized protein (DUF1697 family)
MPRYVVLLRGVNVGKGNRVPMAELRTLLEGLGHTQVRTLLNSGNAVFTSSARSAARLADAIADALAQTMGVNVPVVVKSAAAFAEAMDGNPIAVPEADHSRFLVVFASDADTDALRGLEALRPLAQAPERLEVGPHAAYLHCANGVLESKVGAALLGKQGRAVTTRNWATVLKLSAMLTS